MLVLLVCSSRLELASCCHVLRRPHVVSSVLKGRLSHKASSLGDTGHNISQQPAIAGPASESLYEQSLVGNFVLLNLSATQENRKGH